MRVAIFWTDKEDERRVLDAVAKGVAAAGDEVVDAEKSTADAVDCDAAVVFGVKSRETWRALGRRGVPRVYMDKGYTRQNSGWRWIRASVEATQPVEFVARERRDGSRRAAAGIAVPGGWRRAGGHVVVAGSSAKYAEWHGLPDPNAHAQQLVDEIRDRLPGRRVIYRPKPSWEGKRPVRGADYDPRRGALELLLRGAHCLVTHGSNCCVDAVRAGVPAIVLGGGVVAPISSTSLDDLAEPRRCGRAELEQFLNNLAWCQWRRAEMAAAWLELRRQVLCC